MAKLHKHYEMIVAKAANMDLTVFHKSITGEWLIDTDSNKVMVFENDSTEYFLCLPQHKEACLHWLNGGEIECLEGGDLVTIPSLS